MDLESARRLLAAARTLLEQTQLAIDNVEPPVESEPTQSALPLAERVGVDEIAERYKVRPVTVQRWQRLGLPHIKVGRHPRFDPAEVERWRAENLAPRGGDS